MLGFCRAEYATIHLWRGQWARAESALEQSLEAYLASRPAMAQGPMVELAELRPRQGRAEECLRLLDQAGSSESAQLCRARLALEAGDARLAVELAERVYRSGSAERPVESVPALELIARSARTRLARRRRGGLRKTGGGGAHGRHCRVRRSRARHRRHAGSGTPAARAGEAVARRCARRLRALRSAGSMPPAPGSSSLWCCRRWAERSMRDARGEIAIDSVDVIRRGFVQPPRAPAPAHTAHAPRTHSLSLRARRARTSHQARRQ
jgi:hypothetical protein